MYELASFVKERRIYHWAELLGLNQKQIENSFERMINEKVNAMELIFKSTHS